MSAADDEGFPSWAQPLVRGPIAINAATTEADLALELEERLEALLRKHNCDATEQGWRGLALRLALEHEPCMKIVTPVDRIPKIGGGAEPGNLFWLASMLKRKQRELGYAKKAAVALARSPGDVRTLQNLAADAKAGRVSKPRFLQRLPWEKKIFEALRIATNALEGRSRF